MRTVDVSVDHDISIEVDDRPVVCSIPLKEVLSRSLVVLSDGVVVD